MCLPSSARSPPRLALPLFDMSQSTRVFTDTFGQSRRSLAFSAPDRAVSLRPRICVSSVLFGATDSSPTSLLRLPFAPDPTLPAKSEQPSSFSTGIVLAVVGGATLLLSGVIALGVLVYLRRRARLRSEAIMREERAIWREGTWTSVSPTSVTSSDLYLWH